MEIHDFRNKQNKKKRKKDEQTVPKELSQKLEKITLHAKS